MDIKNKTATTETTPSAEDQLKALQAEVDKAKAEAAAATARAEKAEADAEAAEREKAAINANADAEVARQEAQNKNLLAAQRKVRIVIPSGRGLHERCPVPVGVNGREYLIVRDKEVDVPQAVVSVLNDAVESVPVTISEGEMKHTEFQQAQRISYKVVGYINPETGDLEKL